MRLSVLLPSAWRFIIGARGTHRKKRHALGAVLGIACSLVPLIAVQQISSGMIEGISRRFLEIGTFHLQAKPFYDDDTDLERTAQALEASGKLELAMPMVEGMGIAYSREGRSGVTIRGLQDNWLERDSRAADYLSWQAGSYRLAEEDDLLISKEAAAKLDLKIGDRITLLTAYNPGGRGTVMKPTKFTVRGIFATGYYELDALSVYIPYSRAKRLFPEVWDSSIAMKVAEPYEDLELQKRELRKLLPERWRVYTWYDLQRPMYESFKTTRNLLIFIMLLILIVATVSITSALVMMVLEHEPEIAMLKSCGVPASGMRQLFLCVGMIIGGAGTLLGCAAGLLLSLHINDLIRASEYLAAGLSRLFGGAELVIFNADFYLEKIPVRIDYIEILYAVFFALLFTFIGSYVPARKAARLKPLDIFRKH